MQTKTSLQNTQSSLFTSGIVCFIVSTINWEGPKMFVAIFNPSHELSAVNWGGSRPPSSMQGMDLLEDLLAVLLIARPGWQF